MEQTKISDRNLKIIDPVRYSAIIKEVGPDIIKIFREMKDDLGGKLPVQIAMGIVSGYLRGKGFSWEKCLIGMERFEETLSAFIKPENFSGEIKIVGKTDGTVDVKLTPNNE